MPAPFRYFLFLVLVTVVLLLKGMAYSIMQSELLDWLAVNNRLLMYAALALFLFSSTLLLARFRRGIDPSPAIIWLCITYAFSLLEIGDKPSEFEAIQFAALLSLIITERRLKQKNFYSSSLLVIYGMMAVSYVSFLPFESGTRIFLSIFLFVLIIYGLQRRAVHDSLGTYQLYFRGIYLALIGSAFTVFFSIGYGGLLFMAFHPVNLANTAGLFLMAMSAAVICSVIVTWFAIGNTTGTEDKASFNEEKTQDS